MQTRTLSRVSRRSCVKRKPHKVDQHQKVIKRPNVSWIHGLTRLLLLIAGGFAVSTIIVSVWPSANSYRLILADVCAISLAILTARQNVLLAIRLYQCYAPEHIRRRCAMTPTCSEYAVLAIRRYGVLRGSLMTYRRLRHRCDGTPVIDYP